MANTDIKVAARNTGVKLWRVAETLGISDSSLSRKLRHELPDEEKEKILDIIERLKEGKNEN